VLAGLLALVITLPTPAIGGEGNGTRLYRYKNAEGRIEISNAIPADRVAGGYEVLDLSGQVLQTVAPQLSAAELAQKEAQDREAQACLQNVERVMALYGSVEDITTAEEQTRRSLDARINSLETNVALERRRLEEHESEAAQRERTGRAIPSDVTQNIARSRAQIEAMETELAQRRSERDSSAAQFAEERRLFETRECVPSSAAAVN
jgi:predicted metalloendopeptidase